MRSVSASKRRTASRTQPRDSFIDPFTLMRIRHLEMRAKVVVEGLMSGLHRSPFHGFSVEFSEYRQYTPGDDPRYLDWRLYARSDRYYVKRFEDETNLRCYVLLDLSRSMGFKSLDYDKAEYAKTLAATLAYFLIQQRDAVGLLTFDERLEDYLPARYRPGHLHRLMVMLERSLSGRATDLATPLEQIASTVKKRGLILLISDLLVPLGPLQRNLAYLRSLGHDVVLLRVLDPAEYEFRLQEAAMIEDLETGRQVYVDPAVMRRRYAEGFEEHAGLLRRMCNHLGIDFYAMRTDQPLELALFDFMHARLRRGRNVMRHGATASATRAQGGVA
jgi:uncharacterized protein (DUF58 family)